MVFRKYRPATGRESMRSPGGSGSLRVGSPSDPSASGAAAERRGRALARRRTYNRLYMRAWRANPAHLECDRANRARWHYARKLRQARPSAAGKERPRTAPVCGFCRRSWAVTRVPRLEICDLAPGGYAEVRVLYCGEC